MLVKHRTGLSDHAINHSSWLLGYPQGGSCRVSRQSTQTRPTKVCWRCSNPIQGQVRALEPTEIERPTEPTLSIGHCLVSRTTFVRPQNPFYTPGSSPSCAAWSLGREWALKNEETRIPTSRGCRRLWILGFEACSSPVFNAWSGCFSHRPRSRPTIDHGSQLPPSAVGV
jgi:hypothetical protein